jgi:hypothetical protein
MSGLLALMWLATLRDPDIVDSDRPLGREIG